MRETSGGRLIRGLALGAWDKCDCGTSYYEIANFSEICRRVSGSPFRIGEQLALTNSAIESPASSPGVDVGM